MSTLSVKADHRETSLAKKKTDDILSGPIVPIMLKLALPTLIVLTIQTSVGVLETYFVSSLGPNVIAGVSVVFPVLMLMQMMANGGIGSGLAAAIARTLGAGNQEEANTLVWHGIVIAGVFGCFLACVLVIGGPFLYQAMGVFGPALSAALSYSDIVFMSSPLIWIVAMLSASLRGAGDTKTPAVVTLLGAVILLPLSPALIFGWGIIPAFGVAGAGLAIVIYYLLASLFLIAHMQSSDSVIKLSIAPLRAQLFKDILGVGFLASIGTIQINLTVAIVTAVVGRFGPDAVAGYGIASRLEYIQVPLLFALGTAIITMVGVNVGAGNMRRTQRIIWIGVVIAFCFTTMIGFTVAAFPLLWLSIFSEDQEILTIGTEYLQNIAPFYGFVAAGMTLYFAAIGLKKVLWPVLAGSVRMVIAAFIGWVAVIYFSVGLPVFYNILVVSILIYSLISVVSMYIVLNSSFKKVKE